MIDDTVQTSASDGSRDIDLPVGVTSTPMQPSRHILAPATPDYGGEAKLAD
jgi:hypothetical protein